MNFIYNILIPFSTLYVQVVLNVSFESCKLPFELVKLNNEPHCIQLFDPESKLFIQEIEARFYYRWQDHYTFFFPQIELDCECTCDIYKRQCTENTRNKQNNCDKHQTNITTCSNLQYTGVGVCPLYYKVCCQAYFSIPNVNPQPKYQAYQLQLWDTRHTFQVTILTQLNNFTMTWTIPNWITKIIIDERTVIVLNMSKGLQKNFDLSDRWIYYWEESGKFYTNVSINDYDRQDFQKMGWFQTNKNTNVMERIYRKTLEQYSELKLETCNENEPKYTWTLNAKNYHRKKNTYFSLQGEPIHNVYGEKLSESKTEFFNEKHGLVLKNIQASASHITVINKSIVTLNISRIKQNNCNLTVQIIKLSIEGKYEIVSIESDGNIRQQDIFSVDSTTSFPSNITFIVTQNLLTSISIICVVPMSNRNEAVCISMHNQFQHCPGEEINSTINDKASNNTEITQNADGSSENLAVIIPSIAPFVIVFPFIIILLLYKYKIKKTLSEKTKTRKDADTEAKRFFEIHMRSLRKYLEPEISAIAALQNKSRSACQSDIEESILTAPLIHNESPQIHDNDTMIEEPNQSAFRELQQRLKSAYSNIKIKLPEIIRRDLTDEEKFVPQDLEVYDKESNSKSRIIQVTDLFSSSNEDVTTILIEGDPGYGKSRLLIQLASSWAKGDDYLESKFGLVILIHLKETQSNITEAIIDHIKVHTNIPFYRKENLFQLFQNRKVLLLLDGYDEYSDEGKQNLQPILHKKELQTTCIVVTSRRGFVTTNEREQQNQSLVHTRNDFDKWDLKAFIKGLSCNKRKEFLSQHFGDDVSKREYLKNLVYVNEDDMFGSPTILLWFGWLLKNEIIEGAIETRTMFYKILTNAVFKMTLVTEGKIKNEDHFDIFATPLNEQSHQVKKDVCNFVKHCQTQILNHDLKFKETFFDKKSNNILIKSGLFMKVTMKDEKNPEYVPMHKTFLEFLRAYRFCDSVNKENVHKKVGNLVKTGLVPSLEFLFFPFVAGLLGDRAYWLFEALQIWAPLYHVCKPEMINILLELTNVDKEIIQSLQKFVPNYYRILQFKGIPKNYYSSECHTELFKAWKKNISVMYWEINVFNNPQTMANKLQRFYLKPNALIRNIPNFNCQEIVFEVDNSVSKEFWSDCLLIIKGIKKRLISMKECNSEICTMVFDELKKSFVNVQLKHCELNDRHLDSLNQAVKLTYITNGINLYINKRKQFSDNRIYTLWTTVTKYLKEFIFTNTNLKWIPVFKFQETCSLTKLHLEGYFKTEHKEVNASGIKELTFLNKSDESHILCNVSNLIYLECHDYLYSSCESEVFANLKELCLFINEDFLPPKCSVPSLQNLILNFDFCSTCPHTLVEFLKKTVETSRLKRVGLINIPSVIVLKELAECFSSQTKTTLDLHFKGDWIRDHPESLDPIKALLKNGILESLCFVDFDFSIPLRAALPKLLSEPEFCFTYEINGYNETDSIWSRQHYERFFSTRDRFVVKYKT